MMQSNNDTILSLVRVAKQLDDAGLYHQSDRVYDTLIRVAQGLVDTKSIPFGLENWYLLNNENFLQYLWRTRNRKPEDIFGRFTIDDRTGIIDKVVSDYTTTGNVPKQFVDLFIKSQEFREDLISYLSFETSRDNPLERAKYDLFKEQEEFDKRQSLIKSIEKEILELESKPIETTDGSHPYRIFQRKAVLRREQENLEQIRGWVDKANKRLQELLSNNTRKKPLQFMLGEFGSSILAELKKLSKQPRNKEKYNSLVSTLKELQDMGVRIDSAYTSYIEEVFPKQPESGAYLKQRELAELELKPMGELTDEELQRLIELRKRNRESVGTGTNVNPSASAELAALEKSVGLTDENPAASQYPKAPAETPQSTQQVKGPDLFSRTTKAPGSKPNNVQRVRFKSPVPSSSATTIEELFKLIQNKPDRWEQFNNINKDPKLNLDAIKKLLKELSGKMGKGSIALSQAVKGLNLNSPYWQLAEPALEIALNEFGKYLENPSAYSIENKYDYVNKKIDDILSDKSISNKYKYFIDNYSSYKNLMDSVDWNRLIAKLNSGISRSSLFNLNIK